MKVRLALLAFCVIAMFALVGCKTSGSSSGSAGSSYSSSNDAGEVGDAPINAMHNPEPATIALLGGGLAAFAFFKRRKRKK